MRWNNIISIVLALVLASSRTSFAEQLQQRQENENKGSIIDCLFETNAVTCANKKMAKEIDRIEFEVTGRTSEMPISKVIEESGSLIADDLQAVFGPEEDDSTVSEETGVEEARKKKFGKKKKKHLHKLMMIGMLVKSKIGLLLQLLSTHFQVKFFVIAILGLMINAARFWLDLKKSFKPSKVIYYEHAQHQHHYDHDDDHGIWGRSSDEAPQELAYNAYTPDH
ncbi:uncharacterized protein LOC131673044 [Phymastichus coffea]|uniref:uncharacterized protein LOC131673044 n=1 Tax=Phymastichus coffea TaxID=108790 RepID=UPI00273C097E|nr:uncharacterized protein LOC131673044 [Phymastichus coffea]